jgi:hypothetical protein
MAGTPSDHRSGTVRAPRGERRLRAAAARIHPGNDHRPDRRRSSGPLFNPVSDINNVVNFGRVTAVRDARIIQVGAKLLF